MFAACGLQHDGTMAHQPLILPAHTQLAPPHVAHGCMAAWCCQLSKGVAAQLGLACIHGTAFATGACHPWCVLDQSAAVLKPARGVLWGIQAPPDWRTFRRTHKNIASLLVHLLSSVPSSRTSCRTSCHGLLDPGLPQCIMWKQHSLLLR
jgi:hypothetical protein